MVQDKGIQRSKAQDRPDNYQTQYTQYNLNRVHAHSAVLYQRKNTSRIKQNW